MAEASSSNRCEGRRSNSASLTTTSADIRASATAHAQNASSRDRFQTDAATEHERAANVTHSRVAALMQPAPKPD
jgi:hypothetical protein